MEALDFAAAKAQELGIPMAVNISFGNTYGSHDGTGLLETFMDSIAASGRFVLVTGSGNEGLGPAIRQAAWSREAQGMWSSRQHPLRRE